VGLDAYGVIIFAHPRADFFSPPQQDALGILTHQGVIALQNARLYNDLEQEKERMLESQDEARKKLARDLHDGPTQSVSAIAMRINYARKIINKDYKVAAKELEKIEELARRTTQEIRHMLFALRPLVLESQGLVAAFQTMAEKMRDTFNQVVTVEVDESILPHLEMSKQTVLFYIAEEAITNARKYAQAANIWVRITRLEADVAVLEIKDDGIGFDVNLVGENYEHRGSLGMVNMHERAELINGVMRLISTPGGGTAIQVFIPLTDDAADRLRLQALAVSG
jgi:signal transduction histidine kinase